MNSLLDDHSPTNACDRMSFEVEKEEMRLRGFSASNLVLWEKYICWIIIFKAL